MTFLAQEELTALKYFDTSIFSMTMGTPDLISKSPSGLRNACMSANYILSQ